MGIKCEIHLDKTADGYKPGSTVSGVIKYSVDKITTFTEIIVSLKGQGFTFIFKTFTNHEHNETLVDIDKAITEKEKPVTVPIGSQSVHFDFKLPTNLPPSLTYETSHEMVDVSCVIRYYIRIKFVRPGVFEFTKRFKKPITVQSNIITPTLPRDPAEYQERKTLMQLFSNKEQIVALKATIQNSVISVGGTVKVECLVENLTTHTIKCLFAELMEVHRFYKSVTSKGFEVPTDTVATIEATTTINPGQSQSFHFEFNVPHHKVSLENSKVVSRNYFVIIEAFLPLPHMPAVVKIPLQIGSIDDDGLLSEAAGGMTSGNGQSAFTDIPPSYWEAMGEDKDDDDHKLTSNNKRK